MFDGAQHGECQQKFRNGPAVSCALSVCVCIVASRRIVQYCMEYGLNMEILVICGLDVFGAEMVLYAGADYHPYHHFHFPFLKRQKTEKPLATRGLCCSPCTSPMPDHDALPLALQCNAMQMLCNHHTSQRFPATFPPCVARGPPSARSSQRPGSL